MMNVDCRKEGVEEMVSLVLGGVDEGFFFLRLESRRSFGLGFCMFILSKCFCSSGFGFFIWIL